ncbi:MAG: monovalent cation/H(+) antiporter subunit G [Burkholderiaceae bacterium]|jgi:multicomponent K+:H+ antiporter subunit G|nr:monovalent cation/H(+) antiporter subunit G [Burkholderiaceae bacterium]
MTALPLWADLAVSLLVLAGALIALIGSFNLMRLRTFFERVHAPAVIATAGCWCVMYGTVLYFSLQSHVVAAHGMLIAVFLAVTVPVTNIFLMRTGLFRARLAGQDVPPPLSGTGEGGQAAAVPPAWRNENS